MGPYFSDERLSLLPPLYTGTEARSHSCGSIPYFKKFCKQSEGKCNCISLNPFQKSHGDIVQLNTNLHGHGAVFFIFLFFSVI